jgi:hypothetical protein
MFLNFFYDCVLVLYVCFLFYVFCVFIVLCIILPFVYSCLFPITVHVYRPLALGGKPTALN